MLQVDLEPRFSGKEVDKIFTHSGVERDAMSKQFGLLKNRISSSIDDLWEFVTVLSWNY